MSYPRRQRPEPNARLHAIRGIYAQKLARASELGFTGTVGVLMASTGTVHPEWTVGQVRKFVEWRYPTAFEPVAQERLFEAEA